MALLQSLKLGTDYTGILTLEHSAEYLLTDIKTLKYLCKRYRIPISCLRYACEKYKSKSIRWVLSLFLTARKNVKLNVLHFTGEHPVVIKADEDVYFSLWAYTRLYVEKDMSKRVLVKMIDLMDISDEGTYPIRQVCSHTPDTLDGFGYLGLLVGIITGTHTESEIRSMELRGSESKRLPNPVRRLTREVDVRPNRLVGEGKVYERRLGLNIQGLTDEETEEVEPFFGG